MILWRLHASEKGDARAVRWDWVDEWGRALLEVKETGKEWGGGGL